MGNIDNGFDVDLLSIGDNILITSGNVDPTSSTGYEAPLGSLYVLSVTGQPGKLFIKTGNNDTDWSRFITNGDISLKLYSEATSSPALPAALGTNSIAIGVGAQTDPDATNSIAIGEQSYARIPSSLVQAGGRFSIAGDAQVGRYVMRSRTTNAVPVEMLTDGGARLVLPDNSTWSFKINLTGHRTDGNDGHAGFEFSGVIYRNSGATSVAIQGLVNKNILARSNSAWDINIAADPTYGSLSITTTGENSKTIRWVALVETVEVTNG